MKKILILGGGFGGVATYQHLHKLVHPANVHNIRIELISRTNYFTFSPMLHEAATGSVEREHVIHPLREILSCCGKDFHQATVLSVDPEQKIVKTSAGDHSYDVLIMALGVEQSFFGTPGAQEHALALKWLPGSLEIRNRIISSFEHASEMHDTKNKNAMNTYLQFVIVGGGATGTELAGQVSDLLRHEMKLYYGDVPNSQANITLIHAGSRIVELLSERASRAAHRRLTKMGVKILLNETVTEVTKDSVRLASKTSIPSNSVFWTAGTQSTLENILPKKLLSERGQVLVSGTFQLLEHPDVFAVGDSAKVVEGGYEYPPLAQAATQASSVVAHNVISYLTRKPLLKQRYRHKGDIIPIGDRYAIFEQGSLLITGFFPWILRRAVFIQSMYGWGNKLHTILDWTMQLFFSRDTSEF